jgi:hypothetical protein
VRPNPSIKRQALRASSCWLLALLVVIAACTEPGQRSRERKPDWVFVEDDAAYRRVSFRVWADFPAPTRDELSQPVSQRLSAAARRYAAERLSGTHLCPSGFTGPEVVLGYSSDAYRKTFSVDCPVPDAAAMRDRAGPKAASTHRIEIHFDAPYAWRERAAASACAGGYEGLMEVAVSTREYLDPLLKRFRVICLS